MPKDDGALLETFQYFCKRCERSHEILRKRLEENHCRKTHQFEKNILMTRFYRFECVDFLNPFLRILYFLFIIFFILELGLSKMTNMPSTSFLRSTIVVSDVIKMMWLQRCPARCLEEQIESEMQSAVLLSARLETFEEVTCAIKN